MARALRRYATLSPEICITLYGDKGGSMTQMIRTDDVLASHHLMELFTCGDDGEYDGPNLDETDVVPVCEGEWRFEYSGPDAGLWRFWRYPE